MVLVITHLVLCASGKVEHKKGGNSPDVTFLFVLLHWDVEDPHNTRAILAFSGNAV